MHKSQTTHVRTDSIPVKPIVIPHPLFRSLYALLKTTDQAYQLTFSVDRFFVSLCIPASKKSWRAGVDRYRCRGRSISSCPCKMFGGRIASRRVWLSLGSKTNLLSERAAYQNSGVPGQKIGYPVCLIFVLLC